MRTKVLTFYSRMEFLESYLDDLPEGGVFVPTDDELILGEPVLIHVCLPEIPDGVPLWGTVVWRRRATKWRSSLPSGVGIRFAESSLRQKQFLLRYCDGIQTPKRKGGPRVPIDLPVEFSIKEMWCAGRALDISRGGIFVASDDSVSMGDTLRMKLFIGNGLSPELFCGRVTWLRDYDRGGFGMAFKFASTIQKQRMTMFVAGREKGFATLTPDLPRKTVQW